jgi:hypothetical protein
VHCLTGCAIGEVLGMVLATWWGWGDFASDTASIATMEVVDNLFILIVPGAISAGLGDPLFWWSLGIGLLIASVVAYPVNRWLIARGKGHAVMHGHHSHTR